VPLHVLFREVTLVLLVSAGVMFALVGPIRKLMAGVK
jgi:hypothetical protein